MKRISFFLISGLALTIMLSACSGSSAPAAVTTQSSEKSGGISNLRGVRYCEIMPVTQKFLTLTVTVYNTVGLNECPAEQWNQLDADELARQFGAKLVKMNGPRYWVLDGIEGSGSSAGGEKIDAGGIEMQYRAQVQTYLWQATIGNTFYKPNQVQRTTAFKYLAGKPVYELVSPQGEVYRMQSYSQIADPSLSMADLANLGARLKLPAGWTYRTRTLSEDETLTANGLAYVINDELYNTYQKVTQ